MHTFEFFFFQIIIFGWQSIEGLVENRQLRQPGEATAPLIAAHQGAALSVLSPTLRHLKAPIVSLNFAK